VRLKTESVLKVYFPKILNLRISTLTFACESTAVQDKSVSVDFKGSVRRKGRLWACADANDT
jgi:hypothetical protein